MTPPPLTYRRDARAPATLIVACGTVMVASVLWVVFDAVWWIALPIALIAAPALWDAAKGRVATLSLDDDRLTWESGARRGEVTLARITRVRFRTTFDLSQRLTLWLDDGQRARVPPDCLPPGPGLERALVARGVDARRSILFD